MNQSSKLDLLRILEQDPRYTPEQIATMVGESVEDVRAAIAELEQDRTIRRYKTIVDWSRAGEEQVWALIEVRVTPQRDTGFDAIA
ncbi:MAG: Lrp/AsnC family transcriptional regulator, partial [Chloroflexi bacterium]|nr:Lrp/AsnC family transcriptional regulator [Chloroflexota bacterium]